MTRYCSKPLISNVVSNMMISFTFSPLCGFSVQGESLTWRQSHSAGTRHQQFWRYGAFILLGMYSFTFLVSVILEHTSSVKDRLKENCWIFSQSYITDQDKKDFPCKWIIEQFIGKGSGTLSVMLYKDITKSWDTWNWFLSGKTLHESIV